MRPLMSLVTGVRDGEWMQGVSSGGEDGSGPEDTTG